MTRRRFFLLVSAAILSLGAWVLYDRNLEIAKLPPAELPPIAGNIDRIVIEKAAHIMTTYQDNQPVRSYRIALGFAPIGDKIKEGDGKTPEGIYKINRRNANSSFTLSLGLDYPLPEDLERARIGNYDAGGDIFIHGQPSSLGLFDGHKIKGDWTAGCIALSNAEIRQIWDATPMGTKVEIRP